MFTAEARVRTDHAGRYLTQLSQHLGHMRARHILALHGRNRPPTVLRVESSADAAKVQFEIGDLALEVDQHALYLRIVADDEASLRVLQAAITHRLVTIGRREKLNVPWTRMVSDSP